MFVSNYSLQAAEESKKDYEQERHQTINQAVENFPDLVKLLDLIHEQDPSIPTLYDFFATNLTYDNDEEQDANFGELHLQAEDLVIESMRKIFLSTLESAIQKKQSLEQLKNPVFRYVMQHKDDYMHDFVQKWLQEWSETKDELFHWTPLFRATTRYNKEIVQMLLNAGVDVNSQQDDGETPLSWAIRGNNLEAVQQLVHAGADINNEIIKKALDSAVSKNDTRILQMFVKAGYDINKRNLYGFNQLESAALDDDLQKMQILIDLGANINMQDRNGSTALHKAVSRNRLKAVQFLINAGADRTIKNNNYDIAEQLAPRPEMLALFEQHQTQVDLNNQEQQIIQLHEIEPSHDTINMSGIQDISQQHHHNHAECCTIS